MHNMGENMNGKKNVKKRNRFLICCGAFLIIIVLLIIVTVTGAPHQQSSPEPVIPQHLPETSTESTQQPSEGETQAAAPTAAQTSHMIQGVPTIQQSGLRAGCETYACTMLLQSLGYDMDEFMFADNYLITSLTSWGDDGTHYGPDMHSAMAGTAYAGFGIYAPAMAKSMNKYLSAVGSSQKAYPLEGVSLEDLCHEYIDNDIPVMVWATTWMEEPYPAASWVVDYVDENAKAEIGDTVSWMEHEHCLVLIGYDDKDYYFADSYKGAVSQFEKELSQQRYEEIGSMAIVVK